MGKQRQARAERGRSARDLGAVTEDMISLFASQLGLVATKSQRDWEGWDLASDLSTPVLDAWGLPTPPLICRFQIKSTRAKSRTIRISRANILRMVQQPIPWFVILVRYDGKDPKKVDVTHINQNVVEQVLRWAIVNPNGTGFQVAGDALSVEVEPTASSWLNAIESQIGDKATYVSRKVEWNQRAGRTEPAHRFSCVMRDTTEEDLTDFFLGLRPSLNVENARFSEERFGVIQTRQTVGEAQIQLPTLAPSAKVTLTARGPSLLASIDCQLYSARPWLPSTSTVARKTRLRMTYFDVIIGPDDAQTHVAVSFPNEFDLGRAAEEVRFFHTLHTAEDLTFAFGDQHVTIPAFKFAWTSHEADFFQSVVTTHQLLATLGMRTSKIQLARLLHGEQLAFARAVLDDPKARLLSLNFKDRSTDNLPGVVVSSLGVSDERHKAGFVVRFDGAARIENGVVFEIARLRTLGQFAFSIADAPKRLPELLKRHADKIETEEGLSVDYIV
jgi:hypothetical protein